MKIFFVIFSLLTAVATQAFADDSVLQCLSKAQAIASALDTVNGSHYADQPVAARRTSFFNEAGLNTELHLTYSFGLGESLLEVVIKVDYYSAGDCIFASATQVTQD